MSRLNPKKAGRWLCCPDDHLRKGKQNTDQNTIDRAKQEYTEKCAGKDHTFGPADLPETRHQIKLRRTKQCRYHNRGKHRNRQIGDKSRSTQQKHDHGKSCHKRGKLCLSLILLAHRCTGYGAIDRTAPGKGCKKISDGECKDLLIIINSVAIFLCKIILRQQRLRHNYNCNRQADCHSLPN